MAILRQFWNHHVEEVDNRFRVLNVMEVLYHQGEVVRHAGFKFLDKRGRKALGVGSVELLRVEPSAHAITQALELVHQRPHQVFDEDVQILVPRVQ